MEENYIYSGTKKLRCGYTTGSCATAAAQAAAEMLLTRQSVKNSEIITPKGVRLVLPVHRCELSDEKALCSVIKDREKVTRIIRELYDLAEVLDVHVFGFTNRTTPMMYEENAWLSFSKMITG